jgi:nitrogen regulatory protein P-II 1
MKRIEAIIREERLEPVRKALEDIGINSMTVTAVFGRGQQKGFSLRQPRVDRQKENFLPKIRLEVVCHDDDYKMVIEAVVNAARTGHIGDGKIFVSSVEEVIRIRTGGTGSDVL